MLGMPFLLVVYHYVVRPRAKVGRIVLHSLLLNSVINFLQRLAIDSHCTDVHSLGIHRLTILAPGMGEIPLRESV